MPPKWALGFHHSRYGFQNIDAVARVVEKYREHSIPLDSKSERDNALSVIAACC